MRAGEFQNASPRKYHLAREDPVSPQQRQLSSTVTSDMLLSLSTKDEYRAGAYSLPRHFVGTPRSATTSNMSKGSSPIAPATAKTMPNLAKSHKRGSGNFPPVLSTTFTDDPPQSPAKSKPYLRKLSSAKEDQGRLDLSRSLKENEALAGLGIHDLRSASDVPFAPSRHHHTRNTSGGSQMSTGSASYKPQPFIHPMRQAPRPYTPPRSYNSSPHDEDEDVIDDEPRHFHGKRSMSNSSHPTPLSQTITAADIPRLSSASQTNLSFVSATSKPSGSRRNTGRSELATSPSSRNSLDKTFSRRSDPEWAREERIRAARKEFAEKEAGKDRKAEKEAIKKQEAEQAKELRRQERQRKQSDASERRRPGLNTRGSSRTGSALGMVSNVDDSRPSLASTPPAQETEKARPPKGGFFARMLSCGKSR